MIESSAVSTLGNYHQTLEIYNFSANEERVGTVYKQSVHGFPYGGALRIGHQKKLEGKISPYTCLEEESLGGRGVGLRGELPEAASDNKIHRKKISYLPPSVFYSLNEVDGTV